MKGNHDTLKLIATIFAVLALFGAMGVGWGTAQTQIGDIERRVAEMEFSSTQVTAANTEILVRLERIETSLEYITARVSPSGP